MRITLAFAGFTVALAGCTNQEAPDSLAGSASSVVVGTSASSAISAPSLIDSVQRPGSRIAGSATEQAKSPIDLGWRTSSSASVRWADKEHRHGVATLMFEPDPKRGAQVGKELASHRGKRIRVTLDIDAGASGRTLYLVTPRTSPSDIGSMCGDGGQIKLLNHPGGWSKSVVVLDVPRDASYLYVGIGSSAPVSFEEPVVEEVDDKVPLTIGDSSLCSNPALYR